jgi:tetratricopeptide (TPR) repeat protein
MHEEIIHVSLAHSIRLCYTNFMADDEEQFFEKSGEDTMLHEAIDALRLKDRERARDLLTRLLKTDQKNPTYWLWLSAAVDTQKERVYCLQRVLQADPQNASAKRGLVLLGGLPPDETVTPFPLNRPRLWEEKLKLIEEPKEKLRGWANPMVRLSAILGIGVIILGGMLLGRSIFTANHIVPVSTSTRRPTVTLTHTPTVSPMIRTATPTFLGPTPLWFFLDSTYTPTPLYVMTQHPIVSRSAFEAGLRFLGRRDYNNALVLFQQAITLESSAPDFYYYVGETYRSQGDFRSARDAYQQAINMDSTFAPAFLGRARANLGLDPNAEVIGDLDESISLDPTFAEAYIARAATLVESNPAAAKTDLETALEITPDSAMAYLYLANAQLNLGENDAALESALRANEIDMTIVPVYLALARAYIATGETARAVSVLQTYTIYRSEDVSAFTQLGTAYNAAGDFDSAVEVLNKAIDRDRRNAEAYFQRGTAYLNLNSPNLAQTDFLSAANYDPFDFDSQLGLARAYFMQGKPGDAYMQAEQKALPLARSDKTKAQVYYWEAQFLEAISDDLSKEGALNCWYKLIALPVEVMPKDWREEAFLHLDITPTFTPTSSPTRTPTRTPTQ